MRITTLTLNSTFTIQRLMQVSSFNVIAQSQDAEFSILGNGTVNDDGGNPIGNNAIDFTAGQGFNSPFAAPNSPWDGISIIPSTGTVNLILTTDT